MNIRKTIVAQASYAMSAEGLSGSAPQPRGNAKTSLAQRSAAAVAAKEIKLLIDESVEKIEIGTATV